MSDPVTAPSPFGASKPARTATATPPLPWPTLLLAASLFSVAAMAALFYFQPPAWLLPAAPPARPSPAAVAAPGTGAVSIAPAASASEPAAAASAAANPIPIEAPLPALAAASSPSPREAAPPADVIPDLPSVKLRPSAGATPVAAPATASAPLPPAADAPATTSDVSRCMRDGKVVFSDSGCGAASSPTAGATRSTPPAPQPAIILGEPPRAAGEGASAAGQISGVPQLPTGEAKQRRCQSLASELRMIEIESRSSAPSARGRIDADRNKAREEMARLEC